MTVQVIICKTKYDYQKKSVHPDGTAVDINSDVSKLFYNDYCIYSHKVSTTSFISF